MDKKFVVLAVGLFVLAVFVSFFGFADGGGESTPYTHNSHPTKMSLQGKVEGLTDGNLGVKVSDANSCSSGVFFDHNYSGAITNSTFNLLLGDQHDLNLNYNTDYYMCLYVNGSKIGGPDKFVGGQGQIHEKDVNFSNFNYEGLGITVDGGGAVIEVGQKGYLFVPFSGEIQSVTMLGDVNGSIQIDIWKDSYGNYPPTDADSITAGNEAKIVSNIKSQNTTLTGWNKTINEGDVLGFYVDSVTGIKRANLVLKVKKT